MLVLSRKASEEIVIGENIRVIVQKVCGNRITIAVDAPREVKVRRGELFKEQQNGTDDGSDSDCKFGNI